METVDPKYLTAWRNRFAMRDSESRELAARARTELAGAALYRTQMLDVIGGLFTPLNACPM